MFCDLADSTSLSENIDPEELQQILSAYQDCVRKVIKRFDGFIAKYMGDGILIYFGYPTAHEDDAERSVRAALEIIAAVPKLTVSPAHTLAVRLGIATGNVVIGDIIGEGAASEVSILGLTPNLAARLQSKAGRNEIVISDTTRLRLGDVFLVSNLGKLSLKGITSATQAWRVDKLSTLPNSALIEIPFIGRKNALLLLNVALEKSRKNNLEFVHITGLPGIGKTRLIREFLQSQPELNTVNWVCSAFNRHVPLHPIPKNPSILSALSTPSGEDQREIIFDLITDGLIEQSTNGPLVLIVDDIHWIDPTTAEYLKTMHRRLSDCSVLPITLSRSGEVTEQLRASTKGTALNLGPITDEEAETLVGLLLGDNALKELCTKIVQRAGGSPLFLEELVATVSAGSEQDIPDSLQELLLARLDSLGAAKRIAQLASVFGHSFSYDDLMAIEELQKIDAASLFKMLLGEGFFVQSSASQFRFRHTLMQEVSYETLLHSTKRRLHSEIANGLIQSRALALPETVARHMSGAEKYKEAVPYWCKAAHHSAKLWAHQEAAAYFDQALLQSSHVADDKWELKTRLDLVESLRITDNYKEALNQLNMAEKLAIRIGRDEDWLRLHVLRGNILFPIGEADRCIQSQKAALKVAKKLHLSEAQAQALGGMGDAYFANKQITTAEKSFDTCVTLADKNDLDDITLSNISMRGHMRLYLCRLLDAEADCRRAVEMSIRTNNRRAEMTATGSCLGKILLEKGDTTAADSAFSKAATIASDLGAHRFEALNILFRGKIAQDADDTKKAMEFGLRAIEIARRSGPKFCLPLAIGVVARAEETSEACFDALAEGDALINAGCLAHNPLWFYPDAALAALYHGRPDEARRYANLLKNTFAKEPVPWSDFIAESIDALAICLETENRTATTALIKQANSIGFKRWALTLDRFSAPTAR